MLRDFQMDLKMKQANNADAKNKFKMIGNNLGIADNVVAITTDPSQIINKYNIGNEGNVSINLIAMHEYKNKNYIYN